MSFDTQAALKAGYTPEEIQSYLQGGQSNGQGSGGIVQKGGDVLKSLGLGVVPDVLGGAQFGVQKLLAGKNPFSSQGETPQQLQSETQGNQFINPQNTGGIGQAGQDLAGAASWMVPETKLLKGGGLVKDILSFLVNKGSQGAIQGGLNAVSQGQNPVQGAEVGAITNPAMAAAGHVITDTLPRYIGLRNFGPAGLKLPEVVKAENATGGETLKNARQAVMDTLQPFDLNAKPGTPQDRFALIDKIKELASLPEWKGTPGLSELTRVRGKMPFQAGALKDLTMAVQNASDPFDAYSQIKNMAYATDNTPAANRLSAFYHAAAHTAREHLISSSDNPNAVRNAMDMYAAQTAMNAGKDVGGNKITKMLGQVATGGGGEVGLAALSSLLPALSGATLPLAADAALTNRVTGPPLARGLVNAGQNKALGEFLKRIGISGVQGIVNQNEQQ